MASPKPRLPQYKVATLTKNVERSDNQVMKKKAPESRGKDEEASKPQFMAQLHDLLRRVDDLPTLSSEPEDEILGYDEHGIPRDHTP